MKLKREQKIELAANDSDFLKTHNVNVTREHSGVKGSTGYVVSTNSICLVVSPVDLEPGDVPGVIERDSLKKIRTMFGGKSELKIRLRQGTIRIDDVVIRRKKKNVEGSFPDTNSLVESTVVCSQPQAVTEVMFNKKRLIDTLQALGPYDCIKFVFHGDHAPVEIRRNKHDFPEQWDESALGLIAPLRKPGR